MLLKQQQVVRFTDLKANVNHEVQDNTPASCVRIIRERKPLWSWWFVCFWERKSKKKKKREKRKRERKREKKKEQLADCFLYAIRQISKDTNETKQN